MPFSSQPRKKGNTVPQGVDAPCGHSKSKVKCPICSPKKSPLVDTAKEKQAIMALQQKIGKKLTEDKRGTEKSAFVLSNWISKAIPKKR